MLQLGHRSSMKVVHTMFCLILPLKIADYSLIMFTSNELVIQKPPLPVSVLNSRTGL